MRQGVALPVGRRSAALLLSLLATLQHLAQAQPYASGLDFWCTYNNASVGGVVARAHQQSAVCNNIASPPPTTAGVWSACQVRPKLAGGVAAAAAGSSNISCNMRVACITRSCSPLAMHAQPCLTLCVPWRFACRPPMHGGHSRIGACCRAVQLGQPATCPGTRQPPTCVSLRHPQGRC